MPPQESFKSRGSETPFLVFKGCISLGKILIRILNPKMDFLFLWQNPKKNYESNESIRDEDSMDYSESRFLGFTTFVFLWESISKKVQLAV